MQQEITPEFIKSCLLTSTDYKNTRLIKQAIQDGQEHTFEKICLTIKEVLDSNRNQYPPMAKLFALRLSKELIDIFNMKFVQLYEVHTLESLRYYAEFGGPSNDPNRGINLFGESMEKDIRQIGMSLVRLALECIHAWAQFFPSTPMNVNTKYYSLYQAIKVQGFTFPTWSYYKEDFVKSHQNEKFLRQVDLINTQQFLQSSQQVQQMQQQPHPPPNLPQSQTPNTQTPGNPRVNCIQRAKLVIERCKELLDEVGEICSRNLHCRAELFTRQKDEAMAKNQEMDVMVNELIDYDEEDLAAELMLEMDNLQAFEKDLDQLNQKTNQEFRKKYMGNRKDIAKEQEQREREQREQEKKRQEEQQRIYEEQQLERLKQIQKNQDDDFIKQQREHKERIEAEEKKRQLEKLQQLQKQQEEQDNERRRLQQQKEDEEEREKQRQQRQREEEEREKLRLQKIREDEEKEKERRRLQKQREDEEREKENERRRLQKQREDEEREKERVRLQKLDEEEELRKKEYELKWKKEEEQLQKQKEEELRLLKLKYQQNQEEQSKKASQIYIDNDAQNQISVSDQHKAQELIGASFNGTSQIQAPMERYSQIQNRIQKPISHSSLGRNPQPQNQKITGDLSGAPDLIKENKQLQMSQFEKNQLEILQQQVENLSRDKTQLQKQLEEEENRNKKLKEDVYSLNGGGNRIQEELRSLQTKFDSLQSEKIVIQNQLKQTQDSYNEFKLKTERMKQSQKDQNEQEFKACDRERQQLFQEKTALLKQIEMLKGQQNNQVEIQDKQIQNDQLIAQQKREIENLKLESDLKLKNLQKEIDLNKLKINDQQAFLDALNNQLTLYKTQLEKNQKDQQFLQENQKIQTDQLIQQAADARKENLNIKQQLNSLQLQMSDKEAEYRQLQQNYQAALRENQQLKKNLESSQSQIDQFIQKNMDNKGSTLLQQKLQQKLDEIDKLKEDHKASMKEKDEYYKSQIEELKQEKQKLQNDIYDLQQSQQQAILDAISRQNQLQQKIPSKNHTKSQVSELESIQPLQINQQYQQIEISEVKVNGNLSLKEVNAGFDNNPIQQVIPCPITVFKHFPKYRKFPHEQVVQKPKNINPECLELIFPYTSPEDYFINKPQKQRKGRVIQSSLNYDEITHLSQDNQTFYKQRCLGSQGILYEDYGLQFGLLYQTQCQSNKAYFTYGLYITNNQGAKQDFTIQFLDVERFQAFWASSQVFSKYLDEDSNDLIEILVSTNKVPQQLLTFQVSYSENHPFQIYIPNHICQQIIYREIKVNEFKNKWKQSITNQIRTPLLNLNKGVLKDIYNFQKQVPKIIILNSNKISDYELGIDEIKLGGLGNFSDILFLIKFEILPNDKICIYLTFESKFSSKKQILEQILNGYAYILGDGKSL